jgi:hypothetical protein
MPEPRPLVVASVLVALLVGPRDADACTCSYPTFTFPADGAEDVLPDAEIALATAAWEPAPVLLAAGGGEVAATVRTEPGLGEVVWYLFTPEAPLAPEAEYVLRWRSFTGVDKIRFRTGARAARAAAPTDVERLHVARYDRGDVDACYGSTCLAGSVSQSAAFTYATGAGAVYHEIVIATPRETWRRALPDDGRAGRLGTGHICPSGLPALLAGDRWCMAMVSVGEDGTRAPPGAWACDEVRDCGVGCDEDVQACMDAGFVPGDVNARGEPAGAAEGGGSSGCATTGDRDRAAWPLVVSVLSAAAARRARGRSRRASARGPSRRAT